MAHHLDHPDPTLDVTDVYCFRGTSGTVFVLNVAPLQASGFNPAGMYELKLDTSSPLDYREDITLRVTVPDPEHFTLEMLNGKRASDRYATGKLLARGEVGDEGIVCRNGIKVFVGERGEPFYNDPRWVVEIKRALMTGTAALVDVLDPGTSQNVFGHTNVSSIVVEVPVAITGTRRLAVWGNSSLMVHGEWHQAQHAAAPVIGFLWDFSTGSAATAYNGTTPAEHLQARKAKNGVWRQVRDQTAAVVAAMTTYSQGTFGRPTPLAYGTYVADTVFPDVLRYTPGTTAGYGPLVPNGPRDQNGRGLTEQSMEAIFEVVLNRHVEMGLDASDATGRPLDRFPYLSEPVVGG